MLSGRKDRLLCGVKILHRSYSLELLFLLEHVSVRHFWLRLLEVCDAADEEVLEIMVFNCVSQRLHLFEQLFVSCLARKESRTSGSHIHY